MTKIVLRRFFEMLIGCIAASAILTYCKSESSFMQVTNEARFFLLFLVALFMIYNGYMIRYLYLRINDSFDYYFLNILSVALFAGISIGLKFIISENIYNWIFSFTNVIYFMFEETGNIISVILFYVLLMISVFFSEKYYDKKVYG